MKNKKKKLLFVTDSAPHNKLGGGNLTALNISKSFYPNYQIYLINIEFEDFKNFKLISDNIFIKKKNFVLSNKKKFLEKINIFNKKKYVFPAESLQPQINLISEKLNPDIVFCYGYNAMSATATLQHKNKFASIGDPPYLPQYYSVLTKLKYNLNENFFYLLYLYINFFLKKIFQKKIINNYIKKFKYVGAFAHHHAVNDLKCEYFSTPIGKQKILKRDYKIKKKLTIIHMGHMKGTVTIDSLYNLVINVVPKIIKLKPKIKLEVRLVGRHFNKLPKKIIDKIMESKIYKNYGHVYNLNEIYKDADALICSNTINLGIRVRIITALAQGISILTHKSNKFGIPELKNNYNCLIADNTLDLAKNCIKIFNNTKLKKKIEKNGLKTFNEKFSLSSFLNNIEKLVLK